jgi:carbon-monoxide dehydrogenase small subunit
MIVDFNLNGAMTSVRADPAERLSDILHDRLGIQSLKRGCGSGRCGSCLVLMDGAIVPSCLVPSFSARGATLITYEGFSRMKEYEDVRRGFAEARVESCGYCLPGKALLASYLADSLEDADDEAIAAGLSGVSCRCTDASALVRGVKAAMRFRKERIYGAPV